MKTTRRKFMARAAGGFAGMALLSEWLEHAHAVGKIRIGACDWSLRAKDPSAFEIGRRVGLDGIELFAGDPADTLKIADPAYRKQCKEMAEKTGVAVASTAMALLNKAPLASDPRGPAWLEQTIDATAGFGAKVILLAFFGNGSLLDDNGKMKPKDVDVVVQRIKDAAPRAKAAGVTLGIENTLSAKDNLYLLDRIKSDAVKVYYDIGNSTGNGYDVPAEIRDLGDRICQFHFKDKASAYLGQGEVKMDAVAEAVAEIGYAGWIILETKIKEDRDADFRKNAVYVRGLLGLG